MIDDYFFNRRTIRRYSQKQVEDEMLREMIEGASHAPTTGNMQLYSVVVTRSDEAKALLYSIFHTEQEKSTIYGSLSFSTTSAGASLV